MDRLILCREVFKLQLRLSVVVEINEPAAEIQVTLEDDLTVGDVALAISSHMDSNQTPSGIWANGRALNFKRKAKYTLFDGQLVTLHEHLASSTVLVEPYGVGELRVVGGPCAGLVARLPIGITTVGSSTVCSVRVPDPELPSVALNVKISPTAAIVTPIKNPSSFLPSYDEKHAVSSTCNVTLEGETIEGDVEWNADSIIAVGDTLFTIRPIQYPSAHLSEFQDGGLAYNRPPRILDNIPDNKLTVPYLAEKGEGPRLPIVVSLLPAISGIAMYFITGSSYMLIFCAMSPLMMLGTFFSESRYGRKKRRKEIKKHKEKLAEYRKNIEVIRLQDRDFRRTAYPDAASTFIISSGPHQRLWERRHDDRDFLLLRLGIRNMPAQINLTVSRDAPSDSEIPEAPEIEHVPVPISMSEVGVLGVAGNHESMSRTLRWLMIQCAVLHSPRDLSLVFLSSDPSSASKWQWLRWLPHLQPQQGQRCRTLVGNDSETVSRRVAELIAEIENRKNRVGQVGISTQTRPDPAIIVFLDGARFLRRVPGLPQLLSEGPKVSIYAICLDEEERLLPEECKVIASSVSSASTRLSIHDSGQILEGVLADSVTTSWCDRIGRAIAPIRDVSKDDENNALPTSARLLSILDMPNPSAEVILERWRIKGRTTVASLGYGSEGVFDIDLRRDGPHTLVAGTTGAGKSELLQSLISSLAVANQPDALNFVLIDYKGGSAFQDCSRLPHTVGMVSDLDAHLTERALISLAAELKRREKLLFESEAKDIEDYWDSKKIRPELQSIPRLVLIIDEFASLITELPEFVEGLVDIARRGRSLGVHLVLATQRPAGVVSADIRSNTNLRIALRVTSTEDSSDIIDAPDSANIGESTPGRCYIRSGAATLKSVQTARIGGRRNEDLHKGMIEVTNVRWADLGRPVPMAAEPSDVESLETDLSVLVDALYSAAHLGGFEEPSRPWLPPLPDVVTLQELSSFQGLPEEYVSTETTENCFDGAALSNSEEKSDNISVKHSIIPAVPFGLIDLPSEQSRNVRLFNPASNGHLMFLGSARTGRTTALRTLAGSLGKYTSPDDIHLYGIDCGAGGLLPLTSLPHCGAIVTQDQTDRVDRLLNRLMHEVSRRQQLLAAEGFSSAVEQRSSALPENRLPFLVLLIDRWEGFSAVFDNYDMGRLIENALRLFREGSAVGLRVVMTADRSGLSGQVSSVFEERVLFRMADQNDMLTTGIESKKIPTTMAPGRALEFHGNKVLETQVALLNEDPTGMAQVAEVQRIGRTAAHQHPRNSQTHCPLRVDALPSRTQMDEVLHLEPNFEPPTDLWAFFGSGGDELAPQGINMRTEGPGVIVAGPPRSGRSTALLTAAYDLIRRNVPVLLITPRRSPLRDLETQDGVLGILSNDTTPDELWQTLDGQQDYVVLVDDAELIRDEPLEDELEEVLRRAEDTNSGMIIAGESEALSSQFRGFIVQAGKARSGLLISPAGMNEGDIFNIRIPRNAGAGPVGRGILVRSGQVSDIQVAIPW